MAGGKDFPFIEKSAPSLHVRAMRSRYSMNNPIQLTIYVKDTTYKKIIRFLPP